MPLINSIIMRLIILFFLFSNILAHAQIIYFDNQYDYLQHAETVLDIAIVDSSYIMVGGETSSGSIFNNNPYLLKIDNEGIIQLQNSIDLGIESWSAARYIHPIDSTFSFVQGTSATFDPVYDTQIFLTEINHFDGSAIWVQHYGNDSLFESTGTAIPTIDGGIAVTGWVFNDNYESRAYLMKMDSLGNLEYYNHFTADSTIQFSGMSLVQTNDDGFLILGFRRYHDEYEDEDILFTDRLLLKTDAQGQQEWMQFYPALEDSLVKSNQHNWIIPLEDGNYLSGGSKAHFKIIGAIDQETFREYSITKYTPEGQIIWDKAYIENDAAFWNNGIETSNDNFVFSGYERDNPAPGSGRRVYGVLASTDADGELLWLRKYYSAPEEVDIDFLQAVIEAPDGGFVACGDTYGSLVDNTYQNVWVIKTDSMGCLEPDCDIISTAIESIESIELGVFLNLYPNPTTDNLTIDIGDNNLLLGIQVFDNSGKRVEDIQFFRSQSIQSHIVSLSQFPDGLYHIHVHTEKGWGMKKGVKITSR
jgi:hypothetical protein